MKAKHAKVVVGSIPISFGDYIVQVDLKFPRGKMTLNLQNIKTELVNFIRNQDVLTISQRGVTTYSDTGTFAGDSSYTLANSPTSARNIRSVVVAAVTLSYGADYTVNFNTGVISFTVAQTGAYTIGYDSGSTDKIHPDFPRDDLTINSYPRIAVDIVGVSTDPFGIGGTTFISNITFTVVVYANNADLIDTYTQTIRDALISNTKSFNYIRFIKPVLMGPLINSSDRSDEIMHRNSDYQGMFSVE